MRSVNVAELKNRLSSYLHCVRAGEELLIRDRTLPIAKIVPLAADAIELDELSLVASGQLTLPHKRFDADRFWAIGQPARSNPRLKKAMQQALEAERADSHARILGHKRHPSRLRSRSGQ